MRVVLTGGSGNLGAHLLEHLANTGHQTEAWSRNQPGRIPDGVAWRSVDLVDLDAITSALGSSEPDAVIHLAAISSIEEARRDPALAVAVNVEATSRIAAWCAAHSRRLLYTSTDLVFDGSRPYRSEADAPRPLSVYARTKLEGEDAVLRVPRGLVVRLSLLYGPSCAGRETYFDRVVAALRRGEPQSFFRDEFRTPLAYDTAAQILTELVGRDINGLLHVAGRDRLSRFELMARIAAAFGVDPALLRQSRLSDLPSPEPRPQDVSLDTARLETLLPGLDRSPPSGCTPD